MHIKIQHQFTNILQCSMVKGELLQPAQSS